MRRLITNSILKTQIYLRSQLQTDKLMHKNNVDFSVEHY